MPGRHQNARRPIAKAHDAGDHLAFLGFQNAALMRLGQKDMHLFLGHAVFAGAALTQQPQHDAARPVQEPHQRRADDRQHGHRGGHADRHAFGIAQGHLLGHQFADNQADIGDGQDHAAHAQKLGPVLDHALRHQPVFQPQAQRRARQRARQHTHCGDADLHRGQEPPRILGQAQGQPCPAAFRF